MLNRMIRLQAILEIITNQTASALELLATQRSWTHAAICQKRMSSDYLLAGEGGVCGKFKRSDYCLQIDDKGQGVSYVPIQSGKGWDSNNFFGGWFSIFRGFKTLVGIVLLLLGSCLLLPLLLHLVVRSTASSQRL